MKKLETLADIILKEAPLSSYIKKGIRGTGKAIAAFHDPHQSSKSKAFTGVIGGGIQKLGAEKPPRPPKDITTKHNKTKNTVNDAASNLTLKKRDKIDLYFGRQKHEGKVIAILGNRLPVISLTGINNIQSMVLEPKSNQKAILYFYKERIPKKKSQPVQFRPGQYTYMQQLKKWVVKS